jgi:hypothetical protein
MKHMSLGLLAVALAGCIDVNVNVGGHQWYGTQAYPFFEREL